MKRVFRLPSTRKRLRAELDDELRFHLEGRIEDLMEQGQLSREDAEREARSRFGDVNDYRNQTRSIDETMFDRRHRMELFETVRRETRHAIRALMHAPSFTLIAFLTLALGLGAATTIFTLLDRVVLSPLPYPNADRMVHIGTAWPGVRAGEEYALDRAQYFVFKNAKSLSNLGLYDPDEESVAGDGGDHAAERVRVVLASHSLFDVLGLRPEKGRLFTVEENLPRDATVALVTYEYWQRRFGGDPDIIGKRIPLGGARSFEIIGVLPRGTRLPDYAGDIWAPMFLNPGFPPINNHTHQAIGVAKPGVRLEALLDEIRTMQLEFQARYPNVYDKDFLKNTGFGMTARWLRDQVVGERTARALWIMFGAVGFVLLIAAANVANLFLVRIDARRREVALRTALGASRGQLAVHYLAESLLLSLAAAAGAVALGQGLLRVVLVFAPQTLPRLTEVHLGAVSVAFCSAVAAVVGVLFGLLPLGSARVDIGALRDGSRGLTTSRARDVARRGLVVSQVALAIVLLTGAGLMMRSFANLRSVKPGFDASGVLTMTIALPSASYSTHAQASTFWHQLTDRVRGLPGVAAVGAVQNLPLMGGFGCTSVASDGTARNTREQFACASPTMIAPGYFAVMGIPVRGQVPTWTDNDGGANLAVVSQAWADHFYPGEDPIGHGVKCCTGRPPFYRIVGVAGDVRGESLQQPPVKAVYFPLTPLNNGPRLDPARYMSLVIRHTGATQPLAQSVRQVVNAMDKDIPVNDVRSMETVVSKSMGQTSFTMLLLGLSASIALLLSAVGIYGVISFVVGQRRSEIGIRMALGAQMGEIAAAVVKQSVVLALMGTALGVGAAMVGTRLMRSMLFEVQPGDPLVVGGTVVVLLTVAALASYGPARRAAATDPVEAMRAV